MLKRKRAGGLVRLSQQVVLLLGLSFFIFPVFWLISSSFKHDVDIFSLPVKLLAFQPTLANFARVLETTTIPRLALNSLFTAGANVVLSLLIGTLAAYGISRRHIRGQSLLLWFLGVRMFPPIVAAVPLFMVAAALRLVDTGLILPIVHLLMNVPFTIWMMKSFIDDVPLEVEESALMDGCSHWTVLRRVVLPLIRPGLVATGVFCFIFSWNEFLLATVFTQRVATTLPIGISSFVTKEQILWGPLTASATLATLPPMALAWIFNRYLVRGLTFGAVKP